MKTRIFTAVAAVVCTMLIQSVSSGADFWETYGNRLVHNYSVKTGDTPERIRAGAGQGLSNTEMTSLLTKTFSQTLSVRLGEVTRDKSIIAIACMFNPEPDKCFADGILGITFGEVKIINAPSFSNKFLKKIRKYYAYTISGKSDDNRHGRIKHAASNVPARKKFNPRFSVDLGEEQLVAATPFHSFLGVYVEPKYGTRRGFALTLMAGNLLFDAESRGITISKINGGRGATQGMKLTISPSKEIFLSNTFLIK